MKRLLTTYIMCCLMMGMANGQQNSKEGIVTHFSLWASTDWANWTKVASGEFSNIVNNPIWQTIKFEPVKAKILRLDADRLADGDRMAFDDFEIVTK